MQENWERRNAFVALEAEKLASLLQPVFPGRKLTQLELLTEGGKCNTNYKLRVDGLDEAFVLRIYVRDPAACQRERDLFALVHEQIPVPELLYSQSASAPGELSYAVMRWVDGVLFSDILATGDVSAIADGAVQIGRVLAQIGRYPFPQSGFFGPGLTIAEPLGTGKTMVLSYIQHCLFQERAGERLGPQLTERLWQFVNAHADVLSMLDGVISLVHADFKGFNILVRQRDGWQVTAVLDWEFAFAGSPLCDLGNMLRYEHLHPPIFAEAFIRGYREHGGYLPQGWHQGAKLVDLLSLCQFLNDPAPSEAKIEEITALITRTIEHF